jgi:hypothetical protein
MQMRSDNAFKVRAAPGLLGENPPRGIRARSTGVLVRLIWTRPYEGRYYHGMINRYFGQAGGGGDTDAGSGIGPGSRLQTVTTSTSGDAPRHSSL